jgi:hypothetical protein
MHLVDHTLCRSQLRTYPQQRKKNISQEATLDLDRIKPLIPFYGEECSYMQFNKDQNMRIEALKQMETC